MFKSVIICVALAIVVDAEPQNVLLAPGIVTARSSQVISRTYNGLVSPIVAAEPLIHRPLIAEARFIQSSPLISSVPLHQSSLVEAASLIQEAPAPFIHSAHLLQPQAPIAPLVETKSAQKSSPIKQQQQNIRLRSPSSRLTQNQPQRQSQKEEAPSPFTAPLLAQAFIQSRGFKQQQNRKAEQKFARLENDIVETFEPEARKVPQENREDAIETRNQESVSPVVQFDRFGFPFVVPQAVF